MKTNLIEGAFLVNGSILLPTFPVYACKSKGEFAIRSGPTLGLTPCTPLWLGQCTSTLLSQLWVWFRLFNFSALKFITTMWGVSVIILLILGFGLEVYIQVLVFHLSSVTCTSKIISFRSGIKRRKFCLSRTVYKSHTNNGFCNL